MKHASPLLLTALLIVTGCGDKPAPAASPAASSVATTPQTETTPAAAPASAGGEHGHSAGPHGGTVKTAGDGHLELVVGPDGGLTVYPLDGNEQAVAAAGTGAASVLVQPKTGAPLTVALQPTGRDGGFSGTLPAGTGSVYTVVATLPTAGGARSARFTVGLDTHTDHAH